MFQFTKIIPIFHVIGVSYTGVISVSSTNTRNTSEEMLPYDPLNSLKFSQDPETVLISSFRVAMNLNIVNFQSSAGRLFKSSERPVQIVFPVEFVLTLAPLVFLPNSNSNG